MRTIIAAALVVTGSTFIAAPAHAVEDTRCASTHIVAHRGITDGGVTENSRGSVRAAIRVGAYVEVDLRETRDDKIVLMHDRTVGRTTRGTGKVARLTGRQIRSRRLNDGQMVPYALGILRMVRDAPSAHIIIELKALGPVTQRTLRSAIGRYGIRGRVEMISFREDQIAEFRPLNPRIATYLIVGNLPSVSLAKRNGGVHVWPRLVTESWRDEMAAQGVRFNGRIDDTADGWRAAVEGGVTSVMSDSVSGYRTWCASEGDV